MREYEPRSLGVSRFFSMMGPGMAPMLDTSPVMVDGYQLPSMQQSWEYGMQHAVDPNYGVQSFDPAPISSFEHNLDSVSEVAKTWATTHMGGKTVRVQKPTYAEFSGLENAVLHNYTPMQDVHSPMMDTSPVMVDGYKLPSMQQSWEYGMQHAVDPNYGAQSFDPAPMSSFEHNLDSFSEVAKTWATTHMGGKTVRVQKPTYAEFSGLENAVLHNYTPMQDVHSPMMDTSPVMVDGYKLPSMQQSWEYGMQHAVDPNYGAQSFDPAPMSSFEHNLDSFSEVAKTWDTTHMDKMPQVQEPTYAEFSGLEKVVLHNYTPMQDVHSPMMDPVHEVQSFDPAPMSSFEHNFDSVSEVAKTWDTTHMDKMPQVQEPAYTEFSGLENAVLDNYTPMQNVHSPMMDTSQTMVDGYQLPSMQQSWEYGMQHAVDPNYGAQSFDPAPISSFEHNFDSVSEPAKTWDAAYMDKRPQGQEPTYTEFSGLEKAVLHSYTPMMDPVHEVQSFDPAPMPSFEHNFDSVSEAAKTWDTAYMDKMLQGQEPAYTEFSGLENAVLHNYTPMQDVHSPMMDTSQTMVDGYKLPSAQQSWEYGVRHVVDPLHGVQSFDPAPMSSFEHNFDSVSEVAKTWDAAYMSKMLQGQEPTYPDPLTVNSYVDTWSDYFKSNNIYEQINTYLEPYKPGVPIPDHVGFGSEPIIETWKSVEPLLDKAVVKSWEKDFGLNEPIKPIEADLVDTLKYGQVDVAKFDTLDISPMDSYPKGFFVKPYEKPYDALAALEALSSSSPYPNFEEFSNLPGMNALDKPSLVENYLDYQSNLANKLKIHDEFNLNRFEAAPVDHLSAVRGVEIYGDPTFQENVIKAFAEPKFELGYDEWTDIPGIRSGEGRIQTVPGLNQDYIFKTFDRSKYDLDFVPTKKILFEDKLFCANELISNKLGKLIGANVVENITHGFNQDQFDGVLMDYIPGIQGDYETKVEETQLLDDFRDIFLLDALIGNTDRGHKNFVEFDGRAYAVDHSEFVLHPTMVSDPLKYNDHHYAAVVSFANPFGLERESLYGKTLLQVGQAFGINEDKFDYIKDIPEPVIRGIVHNSYDSVFGLKSYFDLDLSPFSYQERIDRLSDALIARKNNLAFLEFEPKDSLNSRWKNDN